MIYVEILESVFIKLRTNTSSALVRTSDFLKPHVRGQV